MKRGLLVERLLHAHERWVRWVYAPVLGVLSVLAARWLTRRGEGSLPALGRVGRIFVAPSACCPEGSADQALTRRFLAAVRSMRDTSALRALLGPARLPDARRWMASLARVVVAQEIRHHVLAWLRARTGSPAVVLSDAQIAVAPDCELACTGCYALPGHGGREPTRASVLVAVDAAAALGATAIHLIGKGEPLAPRERGLAVVGAAAARPHLFFTVATSAVGVDDDVVRRLREAGNVFVFVSIDGPREAHAARRGEGSFDEARALMARLRAAGVPFGYSTMVSRAALPAITDPELVASLAGDGCLLGVYVRYFPASPGRVPELLLGRGDVQVWRASLEAMRGVSAIPLVDLDELEDESGCRSRLGRTLHIDALRGEVTPCLRVPFAPPGAARLGEASLGTIVQHPFFEAYRARAADRCHSCGVDLEREIVDVEADLSQAGCPSAAVSAYRARTHPEPPRRSLPQVRDPEPNAHADLPDLSARE